ncbi:MAG: M48 family metallopeptidase [Rubrivivax sp.]
MRYIARRMIPFTVSCNERARDWKWEVQLLRTDSLNAFCMPGGKIAFFSGILSKLKLSDDEVAIIMGHETSHALLRTRARAHGQERRHQHGLAHAVGAAGPGQPRRPGGAGRRAAPGLKYSRDDESEADALGLLLAARSGYDPRAGVTLWQKMAQAGAGRAPPAWLSTHPAGTDRIREIERRLPRARSSPSSSARRGLTGTSLPQADLLGRAAAEPSPAARGRVEHRRRTGGRREAQARDRPAQQAPAALHHFAGRPAAAGCAAGRST